MKGGSWTVDILSKVVQQTKFAPVEVVSYDETPRERAGIWMTQPVKEKLVGTMKRSVADGQFTFAKEFITLRKKPEDIRREVCDQLSNFRQELIQPLDKATGIAKAVYTGKTNGGRKDDLLITIMIALYYGGLKRMEEKFLNVAAQRGWRF